MTQPSDRRRDAPPINAPRLDRPKRLYRTRGRGPRSITPPTAVYVGRPTIWSNPFSGRPRIGHARGVILYRAWLSGQLSPRVLESAGFGEHEIASLSRWRLRLLKRLPEIRGRDLQCWCPLTSDWCHAEVLLALASQPSVEPRR